MYESSRREGGICVTQWSGGLSCNATVDGAPGRSRQN
jgi:hypothetical protein